MDTRQYGDGLSPHSDSFERQTSPTYSLSQPDSPPPRSCYSCSSRKVRCDKKRPCSSCSRSGKSCAYPAQGPRIRRSKKTMMADMMTRLSSMEKRLAKVNEGATANKSFPSPAVTESTSTVSLGNITQTNSPNSIPRSREDVLVQKGCVSQYFNEVLLSRVIEDEHNIESVLTTPRAEPLHPSVSPFNALGILSSASFSQTPSQFHPPRQIAVRLWNTYVNNVEGYIGVKLLHLPTDEIKIYSTINDPAHAPLENLALCFAIYFVSTLALDGANKGTPGSDQYTQLLGFKVGLEQAFAQSDFLDRPTLTGLQALAIYLSALRVHNRGKGIWILTGLAIRMAQTLGVHRDGEHLGLSPFQSEIRRRLWWHLLARDGREGEDYGLENTNTLPLTSEVRLPLNINDADLEPDMKELPVTRPGWTTMTFSLINIDLIRTTQKLAATIATSSDNTLTEAVRARIIDETRARIEARLVHCNPVVPPQRLTLFCSRFILRKLDFFTRQQWFLLRRQGPREELATEENLIEALEILEPRLFGEDDLLDQFAWVKKAYPQYHVTMYILWHLCVRPRGPHIDRAWRAIEHVFAHELADEFGDGVGSKSAVLGALRAKAQTIRELTHGMDGGNTSDSATVNAPTADGTDFSASLFRDMDLDELDVGIGGYDWPPWATLLTGFQSEGPTFSDTL